jgi:hypothetical protein
MYTYDRVWESGKVGVRMGWGGATILLYKSELLLRLTCRVAMRQSTSEGVRSRDI